jgi:hypothetical protein
MRLTVFSIDDKLSVYDAMLLKQRPKEEQRVDTYIPTPASGEAETQHLYYMMTNPNEPDMT